MKTDQFKLILVTSCQVKKKTPRAEKAEFLNSFSS